MDSIKTNNMKLDIKNYPGSKRASGLYQFIINHIPKSNVIIELFAGSAAISEKLLKNNCTAGEILLFEKSTQVFNQLYRKHEENRKVHVFLEDSLQIFDRLKNLTLRIDRVFIYIDPPYLKTTRRSDADIYEHEFSAKDHAVLFDLIRKLDANGAYILVSHYPSDIYDKHLVTQLNFNTAETQVMTRGGVATEKIYFNYDIDELELACSNFVGHGRQERQRIKRKKKRWVAALQKLHPHERQAIIDEINRTNSTGS